MSRFTPMLFLVLVTVAEEVISGHLGELNGKFRFRLTELTIGPGGYPASITTLARGFDWWRSAS